MTASLLDRVIGAGVVVVLDLNRADRAHRAARNLAASAVQAGWSVTHLRAAPAERQIADGGDLDEAITSVAVDDGHYIDIACGGLQRVELAAIADRVRQMVDLLLISGPHEALSQMSLEYATLADAAVTVEGPKAEVRRLAHILTQLGVDDLGTIEQPLSNVRVIRPPGRL